MSHIPRPPTRRPPLGEATGRVNNSQQQPPNQPRKASMPHHESREIDGLLHATRSPVESSFFHGDHDYDYREALSAGPVNPRLSAISKEYPSGGSKRDSQISTVSTNASDGKRIKGHIGPWRLGRTLGKGATARVRFARNAYTGQEAAVKIVPKNNAQLSQAHSLNDLDRADASLGDAEDGVKRMPVGIEREVAIMKLIRHPNIMKLYDIWENRTEM
jgi:serine/threonine-protein kinase HSL1 (negative regulator of Swe1 kinase)